MTDLPHLSYQDVVDAHDFLDVWEQAVKAARAKS